MFELSHSKIEYSLPNVHECRTRISKSSFFWHSNHNLSITRQPLPTRRAAYNRSVVHTLRVSKQCKSRYIVIVSLQGSESCPLLHKLHGSSRALVERAPARHQSTLVFGLDPRLRSTRLESRHSCQFRVPSQNIRHMSFSSTEAFELRKFDTRSHAHVTHAEKHLQGVA